MQEQKQAEFLRAIQDLEYNFARSYGLEVHLVGDHPVVGEWERARAGAPRYKVNASGVVEDTKTGLEWLVGPDEDTDHYAAEKWAQACTVDGGGWRLPSVGELRGIYEPGKGTRSMDSAFQTSGWWVWSNQIDECDSSVAWLFYYYYGHDDWDDRDGSDVSRVFAVRSGR